VQEEKITFPGSDGVTITADWYKTHADSATCILLFHQAGASRGEYREIAPKLNQMGFNCLAVDLRSGNSARGVRNETFQSARNNMKTTTFLDAYSDMEAAVAYARKNLAEGSLLIWGSSYSASLVLKYAGENPNGIDGVLAFSPGEYFRSLGKEPDFISQSAASIISPVWITSARSETGQWKKIFESIPSGKKYSFVPETSGNHGSRALWEQFSDHHAYWDSVREFLDMFK
jgi:alpha-beta hydrolase superfamily lysophospholipase